MQVSEKVRCVVCDDHEALRLGLVAALDAAGGLEVVGQAADGVAAIELIARRRPDVAVVDLHMPRADGLDVARACATQTKVILYTADEDPAVVHTALAAGVAGFMLKRGPLDEMARGLKAVVDGQRYVDPTLVSALLEHRDEQQPSPLTQRETEVLQLLADGLSTQALAA